MKNKTIYLHPDHGGKERWHSSISGGHSWFSPVVSDAKGNLSQILVSMISYSQNIKYVTRSCRQKIHLDMRFLLKF